MVLGEGREERAGEVERARAASRVSRFRTRIGVPGWGVEGEGDAEDAGDAGDGVVKRGQYRWSRDGRFCGV